MELRTLRNTCSGILCDNIFLIPNLSYTNSMDVDNNSLNFCLSDLYPVGCKIAGLNGTVCFLLMMVTWTVFNLFINIML